MRSEPAWTDLGLGVYILYMSHKVSVVIPTHNPHRERLQRVLAALREQAEPSNQWELLLVDNASTSSLDWVDLNWHPNAQVVREDRLGLTFARIAGIRSAQAPLVVFVDDDNLLGPGYLREVIEIFGTHQDLVAAGGKSLPEFETEPPEWVREFDSTLALRDLGEVEQITSASFDFATERNYPTESPIGAGMALRTSAAEYYADLVEKSSGPIIDRRGASLSSSGDNDLIMHLLERGGRVGYFPELVLHHIIPSSRITRAYLARLQYDISRSWVNVSEKHGILHWNPIPLWSVPLRKLKAYFAFRAWRSPGRYIRWRGACGMFEGLAGETEPLEKRDFLRKFGRSIGIGSLWYQLFHRPTGVARSWIKRDPIRRFVDRSHQQNMERSVDRVALQQTDQPTFAEVHLLSGERFWEQSCYFVSSLIQASKKRIVPVFYDDGTFNVGIMERVLRILPDARLQTAEESERKLDEYLPEARFPALRSRRKEYPHLRKLTDVHVGSTGWKLVLDSDMLVFDDPTIISQWLENPTQALFMEDVETSYGYSIALLEELCGNTMPERINVGVCGLQSEQINWEEVERWCRIMIEREGTHYCQEQALVAMLASGVEHQLLPREDYIVCPYYEQVQRPQGILHHYVADSKPWYFRYGWRHVVARY